MKNARLALSALLLLGLALWLGQRGPGPIARAPDLGGSAPSGAVDQAGPRPALDVAAEPRSAKVSRAVLPGFSRRLSRSLAERRALYAAEEAAVASCMSARGFEYEANQYVDDSAHSMFTQYQVGNVDVAGAIGYGVAENVDVGEISVQSDANAGTVQRMAPGRRAAWLEALRGKDRPPPDPSGQTSDPELGVVSIPGGPSVAWDRTSCLTKAQREVYGSDDEFMRLTLETNMAVNEVHRLTEGDRDYLAAVERWRTCMSQRGYDYPRPGAAAVDLGRELHAGKISLEELRPKEIAIATADAECFGQTGLVEVRATVQQRVEQDLAARYGDTLAAYEQMMTNALHHASQVL